MKGDTMTKKDANKLAASMGLVVHYAGRRYFIHNGTVGAANLAVLSSLDEVGRFLRSISVNAR